MFDWLARLLGRETDRAESGDDFGPAIDTESVRAEGVPVLCILGRAGYAALDPEAYMIEPIGDGLWAVVGLEHEDDVIFAECSLLAARGLDDGSLWESARRNTAQRAPIIPSGQELIDFPDMCFESVLLVPGMFADLAGWAEVAAVAGETLYIAPVSEQFALVGLAADGPLLEEVKAGVRADYVSMAMMADPRNRTVSDEVFRFRDGAWRPA